MKESISKVNITSYKHFVESTYLQHDDINGHLFLGHSDQPTVMIAGQ